MRLHGAPRRDGDKRCGDPDPRDPPKRPVTRRGDRNVAPLLREDAQHPSAQLVGRGPVVRRARELRQTLSKRGELRAASGTRPEVPANLEILNVLDRPEQVLRKPLASVVTRHAVPPTSLLAAEGARYGSGSSPCPAACLRARPPLRLSCRRSRRARAPHVARRSDAPSRAAPSLPCRPSRRSRPA